MENILDDRWMESIVWTTDGWKIFWTTDGWEICAGRQMNGKRFLDDKEMENVLRDDRWMENMFWTTDWLKICFWKTDGWKIFSGRQMDTQGFYWILCVFPIPPTRFLLNFVCFSYTTHKVFIEFCVCFLIPPTRFFLKRANDFYRLGHDLVPRGISPSWVG